MTEVAQEIKVTVFVSTPVSDFTRLSQEISGLHQAGRVRLKLLSLYGLPAETDAVSEVLVVEPERHPRSRSANKWVRLFRGALTLLSRRQDGHVLARFVRKSPVAKSFLADQNLVVGLDVGSVEAAWWWLRAKPAKPGGPRRAIYGLASAPHVLAEIEREHIS